MEPPSLAPRPIGDGSGSGFRTLSRHDREQALLRIAAHQDALVCLLQARALGFTKWAVRRRIESGRWAEFLPGVYKVTGAPTTDRQRVRAAALWVGGGAAVSHASAGWLWGLDGLRAPPRAEVTVPRRHGPRSDLVVVHRTLVLPEVDRSQVDGIPVTSAARTVIDLAASLRAEPLEAAVESGFRLGLYPESLLRRRIGELGGTRRPGARDLLAVLDRRGTGAAALESPLEVKAWRLLLRTDLPTPVRQHPVRLGERRLRLDFAWPDRRVALECDGYEAHGGSLAFRRDRRRLAVLASLGWLVIPVTWDDLTRRTAETIARIRAALDRIS